MNIFKCPSCGKVLNGFIPQQCECGFSISVINGVWQFTNDAPIVAEGNGLKWLGYEYVGENFEPGYFYNKENDSIGNSAKLAEFIGNDKIVLDVGAGLGGSCISFALSGLRAIGADISQTMMEAAVKRARKHNVPDDKIIFTRMNGYKLELADNSVDAVYTAATLHQVDRPELIIDEIKRVLKSDGYFLQDGGSINLGFTEEQQAANDYYNTVRNDIEAFYNSYINADDYRPFSSWEKADECIKENFAEYATIEDTGVYGGAMEWELKLGLHKIKTRASGIKQLIPDEIHNEAWAKTDEYARSKYGEDYEKIIRYYNFAGTMKLYKML